MAMAVRTRLCRRKSRGRKLLSLFGLMGEVISLATRLARRNGVRFMGSRCDLSISLGYGRLITVVDLWVVIVGLGEYGHGTIPECGWMVVC